MNVARISSALILSILLTSGCTMKAAAPNDITLTAAETDKRVTLTLHNESGGPIGYNLCTSALQRQIAGRWEPEETGDICTMEIRTLPNGESATFEKTLPEDAAADEYRYVTSVESNGNRVVVESNTFTIP
jgi:ABC-type glycerol-3-phosphate transport system substrate-binding protein